MPTTGKSREDYQARILSLWSDSSMLFRLEHHALPFSYTNHAAWIDLRSFCLNLRRTNKFFRKCVDSFSTLPIMRLHTAGVISSAGRAPPLQGGGRRFDPVITHHFLASWISYDKIEVPKWVISSAGRAPPLQGGGRRFDPVITHHFLASWISYDKIEVPKWVISSAGRAPPLQGGGRRFDPVITHHFGSLAQLVEQLTFNQLVAGSNPARPTNVKKRPKGAFLLSAICKIRTCRRFGVERSETTEPFTATARRASEASHPARPTNVKRALAAPFCYLRFIQLPDALRLSGLPTILPS